MNAKVFSDKLRQAMEQRGLTQAELIRLADSRGLKLGKSQVSQYLSGKTLPRKGVLEGLAGVLGTHPAYFLGQVELDPPAPAVPLSREQKEEEPSYSFSKSRKLEHVLYDVRGPVLDEATRMEQAGTHILKLNIGNPAPFGVRAPDEVIYLSLSALLDAGDEVLIPAPDYPLWTACVTLAGGTAVHYICDESTDWYPDIEDIRRKITNRTKAIVVINPNNPTGALYPRELLEQIAELARLHHLILFSDEIYDRLVMDGEKHVSIASLAPDLFCVTLNGLSKSHRIAGFRVGWMCLSGDKSCAKGYIEGLNMLASMRLCSNVPAQSIVQTALGGYQSSDELLLPGGRIYEQREFIYKALNRIPGISAVKPKAAFYIFPKIDTSMYNIHNDEQFVLDFLRQEKVLLVHGGGFNWPEPDHFRVVYLPRVGELEEAMEKLEHFLKHYRQK